MPRPLRRAGTKAARVQELRRSFLRENALLALGHSHGDLRARIEHTPYLPAGRLSARASYAYFTGTLPARARQIAVSPAASSRGLRDCSQPASGPGVVTPTAGLTGMMVTARVGDSGWPRGEASFSAPQAKKILGPERRFSENMSDFEWKSPAPTMPISRGKLTAYLAPPTEDLSLPVPGVYWVLINVEECYFIPS